MVLMSRLKHRGSGKHYYGGQKLVDKYQIKIDQAANDWNRTKDPKYKYLWYKLVKEFGNGPHNIKRRVVPISTSVKADDGTYCVIRPSRLLRSV